MKIYQSWKRNTVTDGYSLTLTYIYVSKDLHEIEDVEKKLPKGTIIIDTDKTKRMYPLEPEEETYEGVDGKMYPKDW